MSLMKLKASVILVAAEYGRAIGLKDGRVSTLVFGSGDRLKRLREGRDGLSEKLEAALQWFSDRWPETVPWPEPVLRPAPCLQATEPQAPSDAGIPPAPGA